MPSARCEIWGSDGTARVIVGLDNESAGATGGKMAGRGVGI